LGSKQVEELLEKAREVQERKRKKIRSNNR
jgi:hypothetical protein